MNERNTLEKKHSETANPRQLAAESTSSRTFHHCPYTAIVNNISVKNLYPHRNADHNQILISCCSDHTFHPSKNFVKIHPFLSYPADRQTNAEMHNYT